jgi:hypothetical protein
MRTPPIFLLGLLVAGCVDLGPEGEPADEQARLIPGVSVDGVKLGMSWEEVVGLLGEGYTIGAYDASPESGYILGYRSGPHSGFACYIPSRAKVRPDWGPVVRIKLGPSYTGTSSEGVGIGSTQEEVRRALGLPGTFVENAGVPQSDTFAFPGMKVTFYYTQGKVESIWIQ